MGLELVDCEERYWDFILELRNGLREGFVEQEIISKESHYLYMELYSGNYHVALENNIPVGWVGSIDEDIRIATHPEHQNKGIGKFMVNKLIKMSPNSFAKVKLNNEASIKLFESCGFKKKYFILEK